MKERVIYVADDGARFDTKSAARARDALICEVAKAMKPLGPEINDPHLHFANGHGYVQHDVAKVAEARANIMPITRRLLASWFKDQLQRHKRDPGDAHPSWFCRMLDGEHRPLDKAWTRLWRIDAQGREWGQPYFADHPNEGDQKEFVA